MNGHQTPLLRQGGEFCLLLSIVRSISRKTSRKAAFFAFNANSATIVRVKISAVIICFNEEKNIADAVESVRWADEIVVVDSESTDRTSEIASEMGARVLARAWTGFAPQKEFAIRSASNDWVFSLDADERVSPELANEIIDIRERSPQADAFRIPRLSIYLGRAIRHGGWYPDKQLRLFDRRKGRWKDVIVHESVEMDQGSVI